MERKREKQRLEDELKQLRKLADEYPRGATARNIRELETELIDRLKALSTSEIHCGIEPAARAENPASVWWPGER
jgi:hypothetical protein